MQTNSAMQMSRAGNWGEVAQGIFSMQACIQPGLNASRRYKYQIVSNSVCWF